MILKIFTFTLIISFLLLSNTFTVFAQNKKTNEIEVGVGISSLDVVVRDGSYLNDLSHYTLTLDLIVPIKVIYEKYAIGLEFSNSFYPIKIETIGDADVRTTLNGRVSLNIQSFLGKSNLFYGGGLGLGYFIFPELYATSDLNISSTFTVGYMVNQNINIVSTFSFSTNKIKKELQFGIYKYTSYSNVMIGVRYKFNNWWE